MSKLSDVKIIDLRRSKINKEKSDRKSGRIVFEPKGMVELTKNDYKNSKTRPQHVLSWNRSDPAAVQEWEIKYGAEFVTPSDPYFPYGAGVELKDGKYYYREMVLVKIPLERHLERKREEMKRTNIPLENMNKRFQKEMESRGAGLKEEDLYSQV